MYFGLRHVAVKTGGNLKIVHTDYLSTPRIITNGGSVVWQWKNDNPYGNNQAQGSIEFNLRFARQYYDYESGLHYNIHRTYDPESGRYMQSDPIGLAGGSNTYNYVSKNPLDGVDPDGLFAVWGAVISGGIDLGVQLYTNNLQISCVNWGDVGLSMIAGALGEGLLSGIGKIKTGSNTWGATQSWLKNKNIGLLDNFKHITGNEYHHWFIERNSYFGKMVPDAIKNQPWNLLPMSRLEHQLMHGNVPNNLVSTVGKKEYSFLEKLYYGQPGWAKSIEAGIGLNLMPKNCECSK